MFHQYQNPPPLKTSTQTFVPSPSRPLLAKFWSRFLIPLAFLINHRTDRPSSVWRTTRFSEAQAWLSSTSSISATKHTMTLVHPYGSACLPFQKPLIGSIITSYWESVSKWPYTQFSLIGSPTSCLTYYRGQRLVRTTLLGSIKKIVFKKVLKSFRRVLKSKNSLKS
jgi:hypothetical protein